MDCVSVYSRTVGNPGPGHEPAQLGKAQLRRLLPPPSRPSRRNQPEGPASRIEPLSARAAPASEPVAITGVIRARQSGPGPLVRHTVDGPRPAGPGRSDSDPWAHALGRLPAGGCGQRQSLNILLLVEPVIIRCEGLKKNNLNDQIVAK
jgi:hypothetical protein